MNNIINKLAFYLFILVSLLYTNLSNAQESKLKSIQKFEIPYDDIEFNGPFNSWGNLKRDYGAAGDGITDDTKSLQTAINDLGHSGKFSVLYLPAGTYKITDSLYLRGQIATGHDADWGGVSIIGEDPSNTTIAWYGSEGKAMLIQDGGYNTRYSRLTWDGRRRAKYGVAHWWNKNGNRYYDGSPEHTDEIFQDMAIGIMAGRIGVDYGQMNSEGQIRRVKFIRNWIAGFNTASWNALDWWIWESQFIDCARGVSNYFGLNDTKEGPGLGAGAFYIYRSLFKNSTIADIDIANTGWFSMHHNISLNSKIFFQGQEIGGNGAEIILNSNKIFNTVGAVAISNKNLGPLIMIDNEIESKFINEPVVNFGGISKGGDFISIGNKIKFIGNSNHDDVSIFKKLDASTRFTSIEDEIYTNNFESKKEFFLPTTPKSVVRKIIEVSKNADENEIQKAITEASNTANTIVHFSPGKYYINDTINIPAKKKIQLVGDGLNTIFWWKNKKNKPLIKLNGPSFATIRDIQIISEIGKAIEIDNCDQDSGRIFILSSSTGPIDAINLRKTQLTMQANPYISRINIKNATNVVSVGSGGTGPLLSLNDNSSGIFIDSWYEGAETDLYRLYSGNFTFAGGKLAPASTSIKKDSLNPTILLDNFSGIATFLGVRFDLNGIKNNTAINIDHGNNLTNALFIGNSANKTNYFSANGNLENIGFLNSRGGTGGVVGSIKETSTGNVTPFFIKKMLNQFRSLNWDKSIPIEKKDATNIIIYRVKANQSNGLTILGSDK